MDASNENRINSGNKEKAQILTLENLQNNENIINLQV